MKAPSAACRAVLARVSAYLDGELPPPDCHAIEEHCRTCEACARSLGSLCRAVAICRKTAHRDLPVAYRTRARDRILELLGGQVGLKPDLSAVSARTTTARKAQRRRPARRAARRSPRR